MKQPEYPVSSERVQEVLKLAESYDMSDVMLRYKEKTRLPDDVLKEHEREIKRFLVLSSINPGAYGMRGPLDELWHTFIIFTSSYARFCMTLGGDFIHHLPEMPSETEIVRGEASKGSYINFLKDYQKLIGEEATMELWPRPVGELSSPSCENCGNYCFQTCVAITTQPEIERY
jgi:hypothetical protein